MTSCWRSRSLFAIVARSLLLNSIAVSLIFLVVIVSTYQMSLRGQRAEAAMRINMLLQVALENAMLKRDIPGLTEIVERLGRQSGVDSVMILNPQGEVRFASRPALVNQRFDLAGNELCAGCAWNGAAMFERSDLLPSGDGRDQTILRTVRTVANREECAPCHGPVASAPVNGLVVVDYEAKDITDAALTSALMLAGAGLVVLLGLIAGVYVTLRRNVLQPIVRLQAASRSMADGRTSAETEIGGGDELVALGRSLSDMAARLKSSIDEVRARERFVQALIETLPDGIRVIDRDFSILMTNEAYRAMHRLCGRSEAGVPCYRSSHRRAEPCVPTLVACPLSSLSDANPHQKFHAVHKRQDGTDLSVEVNAARVVLDTPTGPRPVIVEVLRDLDAAVQVSHEQRLSELGLLATGVAHEIRNPLSSIALLLQDAQTSVSLGRPFDSAMTFHIISQEVDRCLATTESLLKLGTPPTAEAQLIVLNEIVADILRLLNSQA